MDYAPSPRAVGGIRPSNTHAAAAGDLSARQAAQSTAFPFPTGRTTLADDGHAAAHAAAPMARPTRPAAPTRVPLPPMTKEEIEEEKAVAAIAAAQQDEWMRRQRAGARAIGRTASSVTGKQGTGTGKDGVRRGGRSRRDASRSAAEGETVDDLSSLGSAFLRRGPDIDPHTHTHANHANDHDHEYVDGDGDDEGAAIRGHRGAGVGGAAFAAAALFAVIEDDTAPPVDTTEPQKPQQAPATSTAAATATTAPAAAKPKANQQAGTDKKARARGYSTSNTHDNEGEVDSDSTEEEEEEGAEVDAHVKAADPDRYAPITRQQLNLYRRTLQAAASPHALVHAQYHTERIAQIRGIVDATGTGTGNVDGSPEGKGRKGSANRVRWTDSDASTGTSTGAATGTATKGSSKDKDLAGAALLAAAASVPARGKQPAATRKAVAKTALDKYARMALRARKQGRHSSGGGGGYGDEAEDALLPSLLPEPTPVPSASAEDDEDEEEGGKDGRDKGASGSEVDALMRTPPPRRARSPLGGAQDSDKQGKGTAADTIATGKPQTAAPALPLPLPPPVAGVVAGGATRPSLPILPGGSLPSLPPPVVRPLPTPAATATQAPVVPAAGTSAATKAATATATGAAALPTIPGLPPPTSASAQPRALPSIPGGPGPIAPLARAPSIGSPEGANAAIALLQALPRPAGGEGGARGIDLSKLEAGFNQLMGGFDDDDDL